MKFFLPFLLLSVAFDPVSVQGRVAVQTGHWLQPLLNRSQSGSGDAIVLENRDIVFQLKCLASYPTEWVYDDDDQHPNSVLGRRLRVEWSDRKFQRSIDESVYDYIAWIQLQYSRVLKKETLVCRAVADHGDRIRVALQPNNNDEVQITISENAYGGGGNVGGSAEDFAVPVRSRPEGEASKCEANLSVFINANGVYWNCDLPPNGDGDGRQRVAGQVAFHPCRPSAAHCANTFRVIKQLDKCVRVVNTSASQSADEIERSWTRMPADRAGIPGVAVCSPHPSGEGSGTLESRRAVEYFFTEPEGGTGATDLPPEIHFFWPPAPHHRPGDLIRIRPPSYLMKSAYYTDDSLHVTCTVPKYGFAFDPVLIMSRNGTRVLLERGFSEHYLSSVHWTKEITIHFANYGPGTFELSCIAPIWNTTEWANQSRTMHVIESKPQQQHCLDSDSEMASASVLQDSQEQILSRLDTIAADVKRFSTVQAMLEKLTVLQERQLAIVQQILASAQRGSGSFGNPSSAGAGGITATGPIPVAEIKNQLQSGRQAA